MESMDTIPDERNEQAYNPVRTSISEKAIKPVQLYMGHQSSIDTACTSPTSAFTLKPCKFHPKTPQLRKKEIRKVEYKLSVNLEVKIQLSVLKKHKEVIKDYTNSIRRKDSSFINTKTLLIDLDETIIFTHPLEKQNHTSVQLSDKYEKYGVTKRPNLDIFLLMLCKHYELMVTR